jgi:D-arabinose 1-dehydrogenase-like Zn-dependent alcohol dehydrogenase
VIGAYTMNQSLKAIKFEGIITVIGIIEGKDTPETIAEAVRKIVTFRGIHVGSRVQMEEMMAGIEANKIQPILDDKIFAFEELKEALQHVVSALCFPSSVHKMPKKRH